MLISLFPYLIRIQTWHCNAYFKYILPECCVNIAPHSFSDLSIKADHPMAGPKRTRLPLAGEHGELGRDSPPGRGLESLHEKTPEPREPVQY